MSTSEEANQIVEMLEIMYAQGFQPIGIIFYDPKMKLLGLCSREGVPESFIEDIGRRLGAVAEKRKMSQA